MSATPPRVPAKPEHNGELLFEPVGDDADELRALVSSLLGGSYNEQFYLWDVASVCRTKPDFARQLLALIDRYQRLGQMPDAQHRRIRQAIEQSLAARDTWQPAAASPAAARNTDTSSAAVDTTTVPAADEPARKADPTVTAPLPAARAAPPAASPRRRFLPKPMRFGSGRASRPESGEEPPRAPQARAPSPAPPQSAWTQPPAPQPAPRPPAPRQPATNESANESASLESVPRQSAPRESALREPAPAAAPLKIGTGSVLRGRYELQELLGCGGMASVYSAVDRYRASLGLTDCRVAVKIATLQQGRPESVAALGREFHHAQLLSHPNVVNVYEIDHEADASFYTMELLEGERLSQLTQRIGGPLPRRQALAIIRDIGGAIAHAHSRGVVHGDIKPHNVFITYGGQVRLLDFGGLSPDLADPWWIVESATEERRGGYRAATPAYASCEQLEGLRADSRDDIYALACIAYELLAGRHPFAGKSSLEARSQGLRPRRPGGLSGRSWHALRTGLAPKRRQRPEQVGPWLQQLGVAAAVPHLPPSHQLCAVAPSRRWPQPLAAAILALTCIGAVAFTATRQGGQPWRHTVATAEASLQNARRSLQSRVAAATPAAAAMPAAVATPAAATAAAVPAPRDTPRGEASAPSLPGRKSTSRVSPRRDSALAGSDASAPAAVDAPTPAAVTADVSAHPTAAPATTQIEYLTGNTGVAFSASNYTVNEDAPAARVTVQRIGSARDDVRFAWWTVENSAKADVDFAPLGRRIEHIPAGEQNITIYVPIISNPLRHQTSSFYVVLGRPSVGDAPGAQASVTIERGG